MEGQQCDLAIVGGGLAGGLIALAVTQRHPDLSLALIESGERLGGNHRWSWFASDLDEAGTALLGAFPAARWPAGYEVRFPLYTRRLDAAYRSLSSADFAATLRRALPAGTIHCNAPAARVTMSEVECGDGRVWNARAVIDARGLAAAPQLQGGWQVFLGQHLRTPRPHRMTRPVIMDTVLRQHGAYRFIYILPLAEDELFIEDTYYADTPALDADELRARIDRYCQRHQIEGEVIGEETGILPVITGGDFEAFQDARRIAGVARAGALGGFVHPLTSYTLPDAARIAMLVADNARLPGAELAERLDIAARRHWRDTRFYRLLGTMLFGSAEPDRRYRIFERFYRLPEPLIERFYAGRSTRADQLRVLSGRPPVPILRAIASLAGHRPALVRKTI